MNVLIIKTGRYESFDKNIDRTNIVSLGDVLRSTSILHYLSEQNSIHWLVSSDSKPLLNGINKIENLLEEEVEIQYEYYDLIINLEKDVRFLQPLNRYKEKLIGFYKTNSSEEIWVKANGREVEYNSWLLECSSKELNWDQKLAYLMGRSYLGQDYLISDKLKKTKKIKNNEKIIVGFNWLVGKKWPTKMWRYENWKSLEKYLKSNFEISWQVGFDDLYEYSNWIQSCDFLLTHDSLGLHLAKAFEVPYLALFGPTSPSEIQMKNSMFINKQDDSRFKCMPCLKPDCHNAYNCMDEISINEVKHRLENLIKQIYLG